MSALGDILLSLNVARYLKKRFPGAIVDWVVEKRFQELVESSPYIDKVFSLDTKLLKTNYFEFFSALSLCRIDLNKTYYDAIFDLQGNCKSALITLLAKGIDKVGLGRRSVAEWPNLLVTSRHIEMKDGLSRAEQYLAFVQEYYADDSKLELGAHMFKKTNQEIDLGTAPIKIMVCPGSNWSNKQLSEETWIAFLQKIDALYHPMFVFIWGNAKEQEFAQKLERFFPHSVVTGALSWALWQALMMNMNCVISVDSCALHLAALAQVPTFSIYGPSSSHLYKPSGDQHVAYQGSCPYGETFIKRCRLLRTCKTAPCTKKVLADHLFISFNKFFQNIAVLETQLSDL